jgi:hypothetical protein
LTTEWWGTYSTTVLLVLAIFIHKNYFRCQLQWQNSNTWHLDDEASYLPLRGRYWQRFLSWCQQQWQSSNLRPWDEVFFTAPL